ncbi:P-loop NTPase [Roseomonas sp. BN140053]|uniref:P-loop NTPase n=1 Tax=Roseomonas sp. BN140053 TaxID=3391898 RepID=UPI0039E7BB86
MSSSRTRTHLVERAAEALGGLSALGAAGAGLAGPLPVPVLPPAPVLRETAGGEAAPPRASITAETLARAGLVSLEPGRSRLSEELSVIAHQVVGPVLTPGKGERTPRLVLVTSARPGEGKSFTALNIAARITVTSGHPVVLVDADGKRHSLSDLLGCSAEPGLRMLAADPTRHPAPLLVPTASERLSILPYGGATREHSGVLSGTAVAAAVQALAAALPRHIIILDAPPCLSTSEASMLAPAVGQVLMVVEAERTQGSELEAALDMVDACPMLRLVLNRTNFTPSNTFGAYGYGAYGTSHHDAPT